MDILPKEVKLWIEGPDISLIAAEFIEQDSLLGTAFISVDDFFIFYNNVAPLPLGAWLMHNENPNCILDTTTKYWVLWSIRDIEIHRPLSIDRRLYGI